MWIDLFLCLLFAHLLADFVFQTNKTCRIKKEKKLCGPHLYFHALLVFALSWVASWNMSFWLCALIIGVSHLLIDLWKTCREEKVEWFAIDQLLHIGILAGMAYAWCSCNEWYNPLDLSPRTIGVVAAALICWKPANIFIKLMLKRYRVSTPDQNGESPFNAGALIGTIERWLILIFVLLHHYEALGLLIAAKSIIRFSESQKNQSEYVLAGTLMSIIIAVLSGLLVSIL